MYCDVSNKQNSNRVPRIRMFIYSSFCRNRENGIHEEEYYVSSLLNK